MPAMANITVKKNDGITDVTYTQVQPSGGDKAPAVWRNETVGTAVAHRPTVKLSSRNNGTGTARRMEGEGSYPSTITGTDGRVSVADRLIINVSGVIPSGMPATDVAEAVSQILNVFATTLVKDSFKAGYAPS